MAELKTKPNDASVEAFLSSIEDSQRRIDCRALLKLMKQATRAKPTMWGTSIVGFGTYHYKYASGREGDWFTVGFSPRKRDLSLYLMGGFAQNPELLKRLGKHKTGKCCLYVKRLVDVDVDVLRELIVRSIRDLSKTADGCGTVRT